MLNTTPARDHSWGPMHGPELSPEMENERDYGAPKGHIAFYCDAQYLCRACALKEHGEQRVAEVERGHYDPRDGEQLNPAYEWEVNDRACDEADECDIPEHKAGRDGDGCPVCRECLCGECGTKLSTIDW